MSGTLIIFSIAVLAAVAGILTFHPASGASAARQHYAVAGFLLLILSLAAILAEAVRRRKGLARGRATGQLLDPDNRRDSYRIPYPADARPTFRLRRPPPQAGAAGEVLHVLDLSEEGLRVAGAEAEGLPPAVEGELALPGGQAMPVAGEVVWRRDGQAALRLRRPIPASLLVAEQIRLKDHLRSRKT